MNIHKISTFILVFVLALCGLFFLLNEMVDHSINRCKQVGWEFIDERFVFTADEAGLEAHRSLQANLATKCITWKPKAKK